MRERVPVTPAPVAATSAVSAAAVVLGKRGFANLPCIANEADLPSHAGVIVIDCAVPADARIAERLRGRFPRARLVAWLAGGGASEVEACLAAGVDEVALGELHLRHVLDRSVAEIGHQEAHLERLAMLDRVVALIREISDRPTLADVLQTAVLRMAELFGIDRVSVVLFQPGSDVAFVVAEHEEALVDSVVIRLPDYPELGHIIRSREPLVIGDVTVDSLLSGVRLKLEQAKEPPRAAVLFPLLHNREVVGALFLRSTAPMAGVNERLLNMGRLIASVTSVAIGSAIAQDTLMSEQRTLRRKKAEADAKLAGLQQFSEFFAQSYDGIVVCDKEGAIRYANAAAGAILRRPTDTLKGMRFSELLAERSHLLAERATRGDAVGDAYGYVDLLVPTISPEPSEEVVISAAIRALDNPEGVLISFRDVTELREIETELRHTKDFLENLIQSSVDAIVAAEMDGRIILFNRAAEQFLGYDARDVVGKMHVANLYPVGEAQDIMRRLRSEAFGGRGRLEMTRKSLLAKNGEEVPVNLTAAIIYEGEKEVASVGVFTDLRERLKMEEKLAQVQKQLQLTERQAVAAELAGAAAHELNQPLTSILGYAEMLKRRIAESDPNRKPADVIAREAERMAIIVRRIGQITAYQTKPYVGGSQIIDIHERTSVVASPDKDIKEEP